MCVFVLGCVLFDFVFGIVLEGFWCYVGFCVSLFLIIKKKETNNTSLCSMALLTEAAGLRADCEMGLCYKDKRETDFSLSNLEHAPTTWF